MNNETQPTQATPAPPKPDRMLQWFKYEHLQREDMRNTSKLFSDLAHTIVETLPGGPERTVALRKLLESKDAAVRSILEAPV